MDMEKLVSLCRRRGFIFQSSEIYGGINGFWDYGPLGVELKKNVKEAWWQDMRSAIRTRWGPTANEIHMVVKGRLFFGHESQGLGSQRPRRRRLPATPWWIAKPMAAKASFSGRSVGRHDRCPLRSPARRRGQFEESVQLTEAAGLPT